MEENKRIPWATWEVDGVEYKLKLTTSAITKLEEKFKTNLMNVLSGDSLPALKVMLTVAHSALLKYHHGIKYDDVEEMFDNYLEEGGSQTTFFTDVFMPIFNASGFFSGSMETEMTKGLKEAREQL